MTTNSGTVEGRWSETWNGARLASFQGIPYAKPPVKSQNNTYVYITFRHTHKVFINEIA